MSKYNGQPAMVTNWRTGKVSLLMVVGESEKKFEFSAIPEGVLRSIRAGSYDPPPNAVQALSRELEEFLKALGYTPHATEHLT
jgi:hypothetical protein